jgi:hypothetical protein
VKKPAVSATSSASKPAAASAPTAKPAAPSADDEFLEFLGVLLGSTGRNADFCAANLEAYGIG